MKRKRRTKRKQRVAVKQISHAPKVLLDEVKRLENDARTWHRRGFAAALGFIELGQEVLLRTVDLARAVVGGRNERLALAYCMLAARTLSHYQSFLHLFQTSYYGDCLTLLRGVVTDWDTARLLTANPALVGDWIELSSYYQPEAEGPKSPRQKELEARFRDSEVRKVLADSGQDVYPGVYATTSEASHSTAWGVQFYGKPQLGSGGVYWIDARPQTSVKWSLLIMVWAVGFHLKLSQVLLDEMKTWDPMPEGLAAVDALQQMGSGAFRELHHQALSPALSALEAADDPEFQIPEDPADWPSSFERFFPA